MAYYMAVYSNNEVLSLVEVEKETVEVVRAHPNGLLINTIIKAETYEEADLKARQIGLEYVSKRLDKQQ